VARIVGYCEKAFREAKVNTSWLSPNVEYEQAVANFVKQILDERESPFLSDLSHFVQSIADAGFVNSLAQTLIKICAPGVPDFYQGVEFWDFNLVDPDNRRAVDFAERQQALSRLIEANRDGAPALTRELMANWPDRRIKMLVVSQSLRLRRDQPEVFEGDYQPLAPVGPRKDHVIAFARGASPKAAICVTPRLAQQALHGESPQSINTDCDWPAANWWRGTLLPVPATASGNWRHVFSGRRLTAVVGSDGQRVVDVGDVFRDFPVALLTSDDIPADPQPRSSV
jgi:(1->4)-alpha-D-glucan 1-alpha-D-glucosylmutase